LQDLELDYSASDDAFPFDLDEFDNETLPFERLSPDEPITPDSADELFTFDDSNTTIDSATGRELQSAMSVTITNSCTLQPFWLAIIYFSTSENKVVHKGWYNMQQNHKVTFSDVGQRKYSMYAISHDRRFKWDGDRGSSNYCPNNLCYKDFFIGGSSTQTFRYLSCSGGGPSPTPSPPQPSPTAALSNREQQWIDAHNTRRQQFHTSNGMSYKPVQWSSKLASSAQNYAQKLTTISGCTIRHGYQGDSYGGENIASDWNAPYNFQSPEDVLYRWFEGEANDPWPDNGVSVS